METRGHADDAGIEASGRANGLTRLGLRLLKGTVLGVADAILPQTCVVTREWLPAGAGLVGDAAQRELDRLMAVSYCPRCGRTARPETIYQRGGPKSRQRCGLCRKEGFWNLVEIVRIGTYEPVLRVPLLGIKYAGQERNARALGRLLGELVRQRGWANELDALVPVPMHWLRRVQRPCDHAVVLAAALGAELRVPMWRVTRRVRYSPSQVQAASLSERFANIAGCFEMRRGWDLEGKTVCIVDNIVTSGATLCEISKVLRKAGARRIYAAICARAKVPGDPVEPEVRSQNEEVRSEDSTGRGPSGISGTS
ncbi:MAG: ComF family protein [Phycisphaerae bacterium]|nr:ComF family protein [Phycisphaerae bacterium]